MILFIYLHTHLDCNAACDKSKHTKDGVFVFICTLPKTIRCLCPCASVNERERSVRNINTNQPNPKPEQFSLSRHSKSFFFLPIGRPIGRSQNPSIGSDH